MQALEEEAISKENNFSGKDRKNLQHAQLEELLQAYRGYTTRMVRFRLLFREI
ncbi:MAG: hypothetical protein LUD02_02610 [Tannerellaceae bacterium]|nr:hypothetical protein [Tannerellaceae bacterium]MCD8263167.1 hypothetical protein [Tannerellaceae bacterium]